MKHLLITIAALVLVGCGESQQSVPQAETKPVEPVAEASTPEPPTVKAPDISIHGAADEGNLEAVKQHLAAGTDVNAKDEGDVTPLHYAAIFGHKEIVELLIANGADVNAKDDVGVTPLIFAATKEIAELLIAKGADVNAKTNDGMTSLDMATGDKHLKTADLLRKHGAKTGEELKAEVK
tara:strand:+ start:1939 stop:2478 length:540 start_codon:yes stop_codon:yes gene_type:complete